MVTSPVAPTKRVGRCAKQVTHTSQSHNPELSHLRSHGRGPEVIHVLLDMSSWLQATRAYITASRKLNGYTTWEAQLS